MSEQHKAQIRRVIEDVYNRGDLGVIDKVAASDLVIHASSQEIHGREGAKQYVAALRAAGRRIDVPALGRGRHQHP